MTNKEIRLKAWDLCRAHFWKFLGATLVISLITSLIAGPMLVSVMVNPDAMALGGLSIGTIVLLALAASVLEAGLLQFISNVWNGRPAGISTLFTHARRVLRLIGIGLLTILSMYAVMLPGTLLIALLGSFVPFLAIIAGIPVMIAMVSVMLRLSPAMAAFILNPDLKAGQCIKTAWRATKGSVWRMFCHSFTLALPAVIASILITVLTPATGAYASSFVNTIVSIITMLFTALFSIYMQIGQYGLYEQLLTSNTPNSTEITASILLAEEEDEYEDIPEEENSDNNQ